MKRSQALYEFQYSLKMVDALIELEQKYKNPPKEEDKKTVEALRGGAIVLMVASFEYFLRQVFEERLSILSKQPSIVKFSLLPKKMQVCSVFNTLNHGMKGAPFTPKLTQIERLHDIDRACKVVISKTINPLSFTNSSGNPNPTIVNEMFSNIGLENVLNIVQSDFEKKWKTPIAHTYIRDKLKASVDCRHQVAHTATVLNVSRSDLKEYRKFIAILASILDRKLEVEIQNICNTCI